MKPLAELEIPLIPGTTGLPTALGNFPRFRYMGSKFRLLPWLHKAFVELDFETATDAGCLGTETQVIRALAAGGSGTSDGSPVIYALTEGGFNGRSF